MVVPNARTRSTSEQADLLLQGQVAEEGLGLLQRTRPTGERGRVNAGHVGRRVDRRARGEQRVVPVLGSLRASDGAEEERGQVRDRRHGCLSAIVVEACLVESIERGLAVFLKASGGHGSGWRGRALGASAGGMARGVVCTVSAAVANGVTLPTSSGFWKALDTGMGCPAEQPGVDAGGEAEWSKAAESRRVWSPMAPGAQPDISRADGIHARRW